MRGSSLTDEELQAIGISRHKAEYGNAIYTVPCAICGRAVKTRSFSTNKVYKCSLCKSEVARKMSERAKAAKLEGKKQAVYYRDTICVDMVALRTPADALERIVDKELWPFPTYGDLIFEV